MAKEIGPTLWSAEEAYSHKGYPFISIIRAWRGKVKWKKRKNLGACWSWEGRDNAESGSRRDQAFQGKAA